MRTKLLLLIMLAGALATPVVAFGSGSPPIPPTVGSCGAAQTGTGYITERPIPSFGQNCNTPSTTQRTAPSQKTGCVAASIVILSGTVAVAPGAHPAVPFDLKVHVESANAAGRGYVTAAQPLGVIVTHKTVINRSGKATLAMLRLGDRVVVSAQACKADLAHGETPKLTALAIAVRTAGAGR